MKSGSKNKNKLIFLLINSYKIKNTYELLNQDISFLEDKGS